ncbi:MAG: carboxylating nicotinate-nucleotide diphosphorylase [Solirubrobacterales bacterium]|nr:carboxylating nicotinate-nucleotide diphosphorylase [Solirubrobacterales bacterium]
MNDGTAGAQGGSGSEASSGNAMARLVEDVVDRALAEDVGSGDITTEASVGPDLQATACIIQKQPGVLFGLDCARIAFARLDPDLVFTAVTDEGIWREGGEVAVITGSARAILTAERTALNLLGGLSGTATLAARYVQAVEGTGAKILDTRKTVPGMRLLQKAAVVAGGATNHRVGLYDAFLLKENHIAMAGGITAAVEGCRRINARLPIEVECQTTTEVVEALQAGVERLLLDNMDSGQLITAVGIVGDRAETEASGGVNLESVRTIAETGVNWISVGALTHSAPTLDLSLLIDED